VLLEFGLHLGAVSLKVGVDVHDLLDLARRHVHQNVGDVHALVQHGFVLILFELDRPFFLLGQVHERVLIVHLESLVDFVQASARTQRRRLHSAFFLFDQGLVVLVGAHDLDQTESRRMQLLDAPVENGPFGEPFEVDLPQIVHEAVQFDGDDRFQVDFLGLEFGHSLLDEGVNLSGLLGDDVGLSFDRELVVRIKYVSFDLHGNFVFGCNLLGVDRHFNAVHLIADDLRNIKEITRALVSFWITVRIIKDLFLVYSEAVMVI